MEQEIDEENEENINKENEENEENNKYLNDIIDENKNIDKKGNENNDDSCYGWLSIWCYFLLIMIIIAIFGVYKIKLLANVNVIFFWWQLIEYKIS